MVTRLDVSLVARPPWHHWYRQLTGQVMYNSVYASYRRYMQSRRL